MTEMNDDFRRGYVAALIDVHSTFYFPKQGGVRLLIAHRSPNVAEMASTMLPLYANAVPVRYKYKDNEYTYRQHRVMTTSPKVVRKILVEYIPFLQVKRQECEMVVSYIDGKITRDRLKSWLKKHREERRFS